MKVILNLLFVAFIISGFGCEKALDENEVVIGIGSTERYFPEKE
jgi:hypothetical protein